MELNLDKQKQKILEEQNLEMSFWEKIFWQNNKIQINKPQETKEMVVKKIDELLNMLYDISNQPEYFEIETENNKELERNFAGAIAGLRAQGQTQKADFCESNKTKSLQRLAKTYGEKQFEEYKHLVYQLQGASYPNAFKVLILEEALTNTYKMDDGKLLVNKRKKHQTIASLPNFSETILKYVFENAENSTSFKELYKNAQEFYKIEVLQKTAIVNFDGLDTFGKGEWKIFPSKANDSQNFVQNSQKLSNLVSGTQWCTKTLASSQLEGGDFYVFVDNDQNPHIAIRMEGNTIAEVRGIKNGDEQELEDEYRDVAINFLKNNQNIKDGKEWLEKEEWNKRLLSYKMQIEEGTFDETQVSNLINDVYFHQDFRAHVSKNGNLLSLKEILPKAKSAFVKHFNCKDDEIFVGDFNDESITDLSYIIVVGKLDGSKLKRADKLEYVLGDVNFYGSKGIDLSSLQTIGGDAQFGGSQDINLSSLQTIGGYANFNRSKGIDLSSLQSIGEYANFNHSKGIDLSSLQTIGGEAIFYGIQDIDLSLLQTIGGDAIFYDIQDIDLSSLQTIGGYAIFHGSKGIDLSSLQTIGGDATFNDSLDINLSSLQTIGGYTIFHGSKGIDLSSLQTIGGDATFNDSLDINLSSLQTIGGYVNFDGSKGIDLSLKQTEKEPN